MTYLIAVLGFVLLSAALWDAFEVIISPRRVTHRFRLTRAFYRSSWWLWSAVGRSIADENRRETYLGIFGPLSLVMLLGVWAIAIVAGFAMMHWGLETPLNVAPAVAPFSTYLYMSGTTFFTLGLGDVTPWERRGRRWSWSKQEWVLVSSQPSSRTYRPSSTKRFQAARLAFHSSMRVPDRLRLPGSYWDGTGTICGNSGNCSMTGSAGQQNCWKLTSPTRFWPSSARSTRTSRGWRR
jgi:hypothetical protein